MLKIATASEVHTKLLKPNLDKAAHPPATAGGTDPVQLCFLIRMGEELMPTIILDQGEMQKGPHGAALFGKCRVCVNSFLFESTSDDACNT